MMQQSFCGYLKLPDGMYVSTKKNKTCNCTDYIPCLTEKPKTVWTIVVQKHKSTTYTLHYTVYLFCFDSSNNDNKDNEFKLYEIYYIVNPQQPLRFQSKYPVYTKDIKRCSKRNKYFTASKTQKQDMQHFYLFYDALCKYGLYFSYVFDIDQRHVQQVEFIPLCLDLS